MFGRKGLAPKSEPPQAARSPATSHAFTDIGRLEGHTGTIEHAKVSGEFFFQLLYQQMSKGSDPVGIENFLGLLASAGGVSCIATALCEYEILKMRPHDDNLLREQQVGGHSYFIGDLPARYLYERENSLLDIALRWAMKHGARIDHDFLHEPIRYAVQSVGSPEFGVPRLPPQHMPNALPLELALCAWPQAENAFDQAGLPIEWRPTALGFAIGKAIDTSASTIDPMILARIVVEHAVPMASIDPSRFMDRLEELRANC